ncbi:glycine betaine/L-proline ABC transporter ATP-binding protein ProV [Sulfurospirillum sp. T05]|uniref:Glycine betaine/L-proline ABC transporter ATP-binding protein ProV n=2 Tax=Sulfurospirillum tamanense TaxID=2813362 RepID=A0ABS2WUM0_9BACT|nr:glycine betaine/L-proline ABC transporter ATP-binding protein ProV [Sulfurospirillum tamanensis]
MSENRNKKLIVSNVYKVFGDHPQRAIKMLKQGIDKDEIFEKTGMSVGVKDASFEIYEGEIFVVMGLSGSGKSTLVRLLNRLIEPSSGQIIIDGVDITSLKDKDLIEIRRKKLSMVFQSFALMPHMNIIDNVSFGLELSGIDKTSRYESARGALKQVGLEQYENSYPSELSGGMQQRVGLARALANDPQVLLMDEAFSALDPLIRTQMQDELLELQEKSQRTIVFISHDLDEAIRIGDRIAIMQGGEIAQIGTPEEIIAHPANDYVRSFFQGVDVTSILGASHIARKTLPTFIKKEGFGIKSALRYIDDYNNDYGVYVEKNGKFLGLITVESLEKSTTLEEAIVDKSSILDTVPIKDLIGTVADSQYQSVVVDMDGKYKGTISKTRLLKTLDEGVSDGK